MDSAAYCAVEPQRKGLPSDAGNSANGAAAVLRKRCGVSDYFMGVSFVIYNL